MNYLSRLLCLALLMFGSHLAAEPLRVGVSFAIPPYVISHEDRGIELDLMREAFAGSPHELQVVYLPLERTFRMLEEGKLDAIINVKPGMLESAYLSQPVITFHNRVFTLAPTAVHTMKDLQTLRVSAFQRARQILGTTFSDIVDQNPRYEEVARQEGQVQRLLLGRTDTVILEQRVFYYYLAQLLGDDQEGDRYPKDKVRQHDLFPPTHYHFAFREAGHRQWFDRQLSKMKADGRYERIFAAYGTTSTAGDKKASP
ncbi:substrate-binding periplasmic protein [Aeromonas caviae]|uniref:Transporter substrate-binding domain-containing protein n=1 Tax=Aeromonas caviae TaxID=648 RepID=A0AAW9FBA0_AERCA|nr:transporter substrate-binding domain-containing protein [Aeromonas caviae]MDX7723274.1 transporter substrate-binding domain-containing protein [Aeromonas caviae]BDS32470.1 polar amino acid ABC transporter [Aeromonas caviae]